MATDPSQQLSVNEIICQISTFVAAGASNFTRLPNESTHVVVGHETTASALTWALYALARAPHIQSRLRESLRAISTRTPSEPTASDFQAILNDPYLDACVRECLRLHSPITSTMRVAAHADIIPVSSPFRDRDGRMCDHVRVNEGDIVTIPIQAIQKAALAWGDDAEEFRPERWLERDDAGGERVGERRVQGLWGGILVFGSGNVVNGNRACIGYRFALSEYVCTHAGSFWKPPY